MGNLVDYSGKFIPELKVTDFTSDTVGKLLKLYARLYLAMDESWFSAVEQLLGNEVALACDIEAWERLIPYQIAAIKRKLKIKGNDVAALAKATQVFPWFQLIGSRIELQNEKLATLTVTYCPILNAFERKGNGREKQICHIVEPRIFKGFASAINPDIEVQCIKIPPRKSKEEICCKWEFWLRDK